MADDTGKPAEKKLRPLTFCTAQKRSVTIAGHPTSIRIESLFWESLLAEALRQELPVSALVARIDAERLAVDDPPNLASAIRQWVFIRCSVAR
jgi:predicted DNA-binding ribbon-helix-helix protein